MNCLLSIAGILVVLIGFTSAGSIQDVKHVVIFMQENRPFDQYFGTLGGVRGFNDHSCPPLPSGRRPFYQPLNNLGPTANTCFGSVCYVQGQECRVGTPGADPEGNRCCAGVWVKGTAACPPLANATNCQGSLCSIPDQLCVPGTPGAGPGRRCCGGRWTSSMDECAEPTYMLPWRVNTFTTSGTCMAAPGMNFPQDTAMRNQGRFDAWCTARAPGNGMGYFARADLAYYYALADGFLVGDQYFQSTFTATDPNREHLFSGTNNNIRTYNSTGEPLFQMLDDSEPGLTWETMGETLEKAGISWRVFQEHDNFDDNGFAWFDNFRKATPGQPLWDKGMARVTSLVDTFAEVVANRTLPQVSWLIAPTWRSEHSNNHPADGEDLTAQLLNVLADPKNAEVYNNTVFILNYDEGGQYVDHHWTPNPPRNDDEGKSTVDTLGELTVEAVDGVPAGNPMGLGFRVPFVIVSPWTRGHVVFSEVADHTSVIQFLEKRFGVHCPNITPWRRAVTSDLTAAFDWNSRNITWPSLPNTSGYPNETKRECNTLPPPEVPKVQSMPIQEWGTRVSRALPYCFEIRSSVAPANGTDCLSLSMDNCGKTGAVFTVLDRANPVSVPRMYTVEAGKNIADAVWPAPTTDTTSASQYYQALHGPNGFAREFGGIATASYQNGVWKTSFAMPNVNVYLTHDISSNSVVLHMTTSSTSPACILFVVADRSYMTGGPWQFKVKAGDSTTSTHVVSGSGNWYDLAVNASDCSTPSTISVFRGFKGRMETGVDTISDPAMGDPNYARHAADAVRREQHPVLKREAYLSNEDIKVLERAPVVYQGRARGAGDLPEVECNPSKPGYTKDYCVHVEHKDEL